MIRRILLTVSIAGLIAGCTPAPTPPAQEQAAAPAPVSAPAPTTGPVSPPTTEEGMIASAMSAAPQAVSQNATIITMDEKMQIRTLRKGTNMWTCMPDGPSPGLDPMCVDKNGLEWVNAWMHHTNPPSGKLGFGYMLMGGSDASNDDPFAMTPSAGQSWVDTGPHVMLFNIGNQMEGYPASHDDPKQPFIMFPNTPYQHLMIPVK